MNKKILFIAPAESTQGGISAVINNYKLSGFWLQYNCRHFSTSIESDFRQVGSSLPFQQKTWSFLQRLLLLFCLLASI